MLVNKFPTMLLSYSMVIDHNLYETDFLDEFVQIKHISN